MIVMTVQQYWDMVVSSFLTGLLTMAVFIILIRSYNDR